MNRQRIGVAALGLIVVLSAAVVFAFSRESAKPHSGSDATVLTLSIFVQHNRPYLPPQKDIVADAIERNTHWRIEVTERYYERGRNWVEWLALFAASGTIPTVFVFPADGVDTVGQYADRFVDLEPYLSDPGVTPHVNAWLEPPLLDSMRTFDSGKLVGWPLGIAPDLRKPQNRERFHEQYLDARTHSHYITVREDVLAALGYTFTPHAELHEELRQNNRRLTYQDVRIDPEIGTIDEFEHFLRRVRELGLEAPDGTPLIPYGGTDPTIQFGAAFGFYHFRTFNGEIHGFYGSPYAKEFFRTLNRWYREGLLDVDSLIARDHHGAIADKIAEGRVAAWKWWPIAERDAMERRLEENVPGATPRYIPVPPFKPEIPPYTSALRIGAVQMAGINRTYPMAGELIEYLDWLYSDTAQELIVWGDASSGLWHVEDGRRVISDPDLREAVRINDVTPDGKDACYYGIPIPSGDSLFGNYTSSWVYGLHRHGFNWYLEELRGAVRYTARSEMRRLAGRPMNSVDGSLMYARGLDAAKLGNFFWTESAPFNTALLLAENDEDFERAWSDVYTAFMAAGDYRQAVADLQQWRTIMGYR